jgi:hypothetical protein
VKDKLLEKKFQGKSVMNLSKTVMKGKLLEGKFQYSLGALLAHSNFTDTTDAHLETIYAACNKVNITMHMLTGNFAVSRPDKVRSLQLSIDQAPREPLTSVKVTINAWISTTPVSTSLKEPFDGVPQYQPADFSENLSFASGFSFTNILFTIRPFRIGLL